MLAYNALIDRSVFYRSQIPHQSIIISTMPTPHLLRVGSRAVAVPEATWLQWYLEEHIRDMVHFRVSKTAAFYRSASEIFHSGAHMAEEDTDRMSFFALYQTERKRCLESPEFKDHVRQETGLWQPGLRGRDVGEFAIGEFTLVEVLGSYEYNERMCFSV